LRAALSDHPRWDPCRVRDVCSSSRIAFEFKFVFFLEDETAHSVLCVFPLDKPALSAARWRNDYADLLEDVPTSPAFGVTQFHFHVDHFRFYHHGEVNDCLHRLAWRIQKRTWVRNRLLFHQVIPRDLTTLVSRFLFPFFLARNLAGPQHAHTVPEA